MKTDRDFTPVYYQLAEDIKQLIESGQLKPGDAIPSESQLVKEYGVSRVTVRRGLALLLEAGLIETVRGKGNFVASPRLNQVTLDFKESNFVRDKKFSFKLIKVKRIAVDADIATRLGIIEGTKLFMIKRLINGENGPIGIDIRYLPYLKGKPILENEIEYADFPDIVAKHTDVTIRKIEIHIGASPLKAEDAEILGADKGYPTLTVTQTIYAKDNRILGFSKTTYLGGTFELSAVSYPYSAKV